MWVIGLAASLALSSLPPPFSLSHTHVHSGLSVLVVQIVALPLVIGDFGLVMSPEIPHW